MKKALTIAGTVLLAAACFGQGLPFGMHDAAFRERTSRFLDGLVGAWRMEEPSGAVRLDSFKNGLTMFNSNTVTSSTGISGNCSTFAAASKQFLYTPNDVSMQTSNMSYTITCWVNATTVPDWAAIVCRSDWNSATQEFGLFLEGATHKPQFQIRDKATSTSTATYGTALATGGWHFICAYRDWPNSIIGISMDNGAFVNVTSTLAVTNKVVTTTIGGYSDSQAQSATTWNGSIDEVYFWNRILTTPEVAQLYSMSNTVTFPRFSR